MAQMKELHEPLKLIRCYQKVSNKCVLEKWMQTCRIESVVDPEAREALITFLATSILAFTICWTPAQARGVAILCSSGDID